MPERIALVVALGAPVMGQLDDGVILLVAVADEGEGELAAGEVLLAQQLHSELIAVELQRFGKVVDTNHGVQQLHGEILAV
jgi:hypothetical protein